MKKVISLKQGIGLIKLKEREYLRKELEDSVEVRYESTSEEN